MSQRKESLILMTLPYLSLWEKVFLAGLGIGLITFYSVGTIGLNVVRVSLAGLTVIYFLSSFKILEIPKGDNEVFGFKELLAWTIIPKILWIASAFSLLGFFVYSLKLGHQGHMQAIMPGGLSIAIGLIILVYALATQTKHLSKLTPAVIRCFPIMLADFYFVLETIKNQ